MYKSDGTMIHFKNPKVQASVQANIFAVSGQAETKTLSELFPNVLNQLETAKMRLSKMNEAAGADAKENDAAQNDDDDDVPDLVGDFDEKSRLE
ncbi:hypothetical protein AAHC03_020696 [Spirometra sp. Aus1]|nr:unnamed protein product [Spirometra erinaceieuropaei]